MRKYGNNMRKIGKHNSMLMHKFVNVNTPFSPIIRLVEST